MSNPLANDRTTDWVEVYRDTANEFRWRRKARNGEPLSQSSEGYHSSIYAEQIAADLNPGIEIQLVDRTEQ